MKMIVETFGDDDGNEVTNHRNLNEPCGVLTGSFTLDYTETVEGEYIKKIQTCNAHCKAWENEDQYVVVTLGKGEGRDYLQIGVCLHSISATEENGYCITIDLDEEFVSNYTQNGLPQGEFGTCKVAIWGAVDVERIYK